MYLNFSFFKIWHGFWFFLIIDNHLKSKVMKKLIYLTLFAFLFAVEMPLSAQERSEEYLGLPGDNLNLYAVMNLFQESETLESFERGLNDPEIMINNLDLNGNNLVDYIMVYDYPDDDIHTIVLRTALTKKEYQDIAVFTVQKFRDGTVQIQLIGDEALYGPNYIIEPIYDETPNPGYLGSANSKRNVTVVRTTYYEVASWPLIVYISRPSYRVWRSAWSWGYYPEYWHPWTPHYWHYYYGYHYNSFDHYYSYYRPWKHYRCDRYRDGYYSNIRQHSPTVVVNINNGNYRSTYSHPEKRREGEVLYSQRVSNGGTTVSARGRSTGNMNDKKSPHAIETANERASRPNIDSGRNQSLDRAKKSSEVKDSKAPVRQNASGVNRTNDRTSRDKVATSPSIDRAAKSENQSKRSQPSTIIERQKPASQSRNIERSSPERSKPAVRPAASETRIEKSRPSSMERSQPAKSSNQKAPEVKKQERSSNRQNSEAAKKENVSNRKQSSSSNDSGKSRSQKR
jgi:hypothetical protein